MRRLTGGKRNAKVIGQVRKPKPSLKDNLWVLQLLDDPSLAADLNYSRDQLVTKTRGNSLCVACKGGKFLCGKTRCPLVVRFSSYFRSAPLLQGTDLDGACPPGVLWVESAILTFMQDLLFLPSTKTRAIMTSPNHGLESPSTKLWVSAPCS